VDGIGGRGCVVETTDEAPQVADKCVGGGGRVRLCVPEAGRGSSHGQCWGRFPSRANGAYIHTYMHTHTHTHAHTHTHTLHEGQCWGRLHVVWPPGRACVSGDVY